MSERGWRECVVEYIRVEALPEDKFGHQPRLYALAKTIGQDIEYDDDILFAAAWMHDLGVFLGHRPQDPAQLSVWDHVPYTIGKSRDLLTGWGFPLEKLDGVAEAIRHHQDLGRHTATRRRYSGTIGCDWHSPGRGKGGTRYALPEFQLNSASFESCS